MIRHAASPASQVTVTLHPISVGMVKQQTIKSAMAKFKISLLTRDDFLYRLRSKVEKTTRLPIKPKNNKTEYTVMLKMDASRFL